MPQGNPIYLRRGDAATWLSVDPTLDSGEPGLETDTGLVKYGDGATAWSALPYSTVPTHAAAHGFGGVDAITIEPSQVIGLDAFIGDVQTALPNKSDVGHTHALDDLSDVTSSAAVSGQALIFGGTVWEPGNVSTGVTVSDIAPTSPISGQEWFDSTTGKTYVWYDSFWVEENSVGANGTNGANGADGVSGIPTAVSVSSNITLATNNRYFVDTSAVRTLTLPASPSMGHEIQIFDATGTAGTNNITIANNSQKINGVLDSAVIDVNGAAVVFIYTGSTYGWRLG